MIRTDEPDLIFKTEAVKFEAVVEDLKERYEAGQPVLVGTASVAKSEELSLLLDKQGIPHHVLNAKHHAQEAMIVAQAGRLNAITVATNMAGRGVDIVLGGNPEGLAHDEVRAQGLDPDSDEGRARYEALLEKFKDQCAAEADEVRALGGLYVLGSERHESRRIDNQLRGRSGRQGDPGESRFYLSLEDELMRLFATGAVSWVMDRALPEDVPIEARMVTKAIERAQHTVEGRNAETRKELLKYDEVSNEQRKVIYARRLQIIDGEDLKAHTEDLLTEMVDRVVANHCPNNFPEDWDLEGLVVELTQYYPTRFTVEDLEAATDIQQLTESILTEALELLRREGDDLPRRCRDSPRGRAQRPDPDHRPALARAPRRDGLPERGHPPARHRPDRPARRLAARGLRDVRQAHGLDRRRLPALCHARAGDCRPGRGPRLRPGGLRGRRRPRRRPGRGRGARRTSSPPGALAPAQPQGSAVRAPASGRGPNPRPRDALRFWPGGRQQRQGAPSRGGNGGGATAHRHPPAARSLPQGPGSSGGPPAKVGRNEPCWCGSGRKFKVCHGAS